MQMIDFSAALTTSPLVLLDTHILIWLRSGNSRLKPPIIKLVESCFREGKLCLSPISAWEIGVLVSKHRLDLGQSPNAWIKDFARKFNVSVLEFTSEIAINSSFLPGEVHGDPADRILIATAIAYSAAILTADKNILSYGKQGFIRVIRA